MAVPVSKAIAFAVRGPIARDDLPGLCDRVCGLLAESRASVAFCDVSGVEPDAVTVDALARLQLAARRYECQVRLRGASPALLELVEFMGLSEVVAASRPGPSTLRHRDQEGS
jgi:ABC-type transporter Mla MlaB component